MALLGPQVAPPLGTMAFLPLYYLFFFFLTNLLFILGLLLDFKKFTLKKYKKYPT
jgi:hypothetical protein